MRALRRTAPVLAALLALWPVAGAHAAFPGRNGLLVVAPPSGRGLVLVTPDGRRATRICTDPVLCGRPATPRFAPDGRDIVFTSGTGPDIVSVDGTCVWCGLGTPLTGPGTTPAFTPDGRAITDATGGGLARTTLSGTTQTITPAVETGAVWSSRGARAFSRGGVVWFVPAGGSVARRLGAGRDPSFAPDGLLVAYARAGWVFTVRIDGRGTRRILRGGRPAVSPDGRSLAVVGPGGRIVVAGIRGRGARALPGLRGTAVDWQPLPRTPPERCTPPSGATVIALSPEAVLTQLGVTADPVGCLVASGRRTRLAVATPPTAVGAPVPGPAMLAGRFALLATVTDAGTGTCSEGLTRYDLATGRASTLYTRACGTRPGTVDELGLDSSGFAAWHASEQTAVGQPLLDMTCPVAGFCLAVDAHGNAATTADPTAPASGWSVARVAPALARVGCHATTLCVGLAGATMTVSTDPAGGTGAWSAPVSVDTAGLGDVACPSDTLCAAVDAAGNVLTSNDPTGGPHAWQFTNVAGTDPLDGIDCPSVNLCVAVGANGDVLASSDPTGGPAAWSRSTAEPGATLTGVACPTTSLCLATDTAGHVLSTSTPAAGGPWTVAAVPGPPVPLAPPACPQTSLCLTAAGSAAIAIHDPGTPAETITATNLAGALAAVACVPGTATCAASDVGGVVYATRDASSGISPWTPAPIDAPPCGACVAEQIYVADSSGISALDTRLPGAGGAITGVRLGGDERSVSWLDAGALRRAPLR